MSLDISLRNQIDETKSKEEKLCMEKFNRGKIIFVIDI